MGRGATAEMLIVSSKDWGAWGSRGNVEQDGRVLHLPPEFMAGLNCEASWSSALKEVGHTEMPPFDEMPPTVNPSPSYVDLFHVSPSMG